MQNNLLSTNLVRISKQSIVESQKKFLRELIKYFPGMFFYAINGDFYVKTSPDRIKHLLFFLKYHTNSLFQELIDLSCVDYIEKKRRFEIFYNLLSVKYNTRLTITIHISEGIPVESVVAVHPAANWYEREVWDMFGVYFQNHPDLRRMLTDYGFKGHPLRKDFPLTGYIEVRYDDFSKRVIYEEVSLTQEYRNFSLENPWVDVSRDK